MVGRKKMTNLFTLIYDRLFLISKRTYASLCILDSQKCVQKRAYFGPHKLCTQGCVICTEMAQFLALI